MTSRRVKKNEIEDFPYKKLLQYSQKIKLDPKVFFLALFHIFSYKANDFRETLIGIENRGKKSKIKISEINIDSSQTVSNFLKMFKNQIIFDGSSFLISLPYSSENSLDKKNKKNIGKGNFNYRIELKNEKIILEALCGSKEDTDRYSKALLNLTNQFLEKGEIKIEKLELISSQEKKKLIENFNNLDNKKPKYSNVFCYFEERAYANREEVAMEYKEKKITYWETLKKACFIDSLIKKQTKKKQKFIVVFLPKELDLIYSILGIIRSENISVLIRPNYPKERIKAMLKKISPDIVITKNKYKKHLQFLLGETKNQKKGKILLLDNISSESADVKIIKFIKPKGEYNFLSNIIFTSGSTGNQKAVMLSHKNLSQFLSHGISEILDLDEKLRVMSFFTIEFSGFLREIFLTLFQGNTLCFLPNENLRLDHVFLEKWVKDNNINYLNINADVCRNLIKYSQEPQKLTCLRHLYPGPGNHINDIFLHRFIKNHPETSVYEIWGMSEMGLMRNKHKIISEDFNKARIPIFNTFQDDQIKAITLNRDGNIQPIGFVGNLHLHSHCISSGYYNNKKLADEYFISNPFGSKNNDIVLKTGDFFKILENGNVEYFGRRDDQLNIRGVKVFASEIRSYLLRYSGIKECVISTRKTKKEGVYTIAFLIGDRNKPDKLKNYLGKWLPEYAMPRYFIFLEKMPLLPNKKIDLKKLEKFSFEYKMPKNYQNSLTNTEEKIHEIWQNVLGVKSIIDINENFINIGGDSLRAMKIYSEINEAYPDILKTSDIFLYPTIKKIAKKIDENTKKNK